MTLSLSAAPGPLTRRSSERELDGSKKRATSAGGIERKPQGNRTTISTVHASLLLFFRHALCRSSYFFLIQVSTYSPVLSQSQLRGYQFNTFFRSPADEFINI